MTGTMDVFPDTNFFLECKAPEECAWSDIVAAHTVNLLVCRGVRRELDDQKRTARGRRQERARKLSSQLRTSDQAGQPLVLRESGPRVTLSAARIVPRRTAYPPEIQRDHPDDRIVADILDQIGSSSTPVASFLTDDGHAAATATHVGIKVLYVPDGADDRVPTWRLPSEPDPLQKRVAELEKKVIGLAVSGPKVEIAFQVDGSGTCEQLDLRFVRYAPLRPAEVSEILARLDRLFPPDIALNTSPTGSRETVVRGFTSGVPGGLGRFGIPDSFISAYRTERTTWAEAVQRMLEGVHGPLMSATNMVPIAVNLRNVGRQPALSLRVTAEGAGGLFLCRVGRMSDVRSDPYLDLPDPPRFDPLGPKGASILSQMFPQPRARQDRDPHAFLWIGDCRGRFAEATVECAEFLHGLDHSLEIRAIPDRAAVKRGSAALRCVVRASNLPEAVIATLPCRITREEGDTMELVSRLVSELPRPSSPT